MKKWKKTLIIIFDMVIGIYLMLAATAFNKPMEEDTVCQDIHINIERGVTQGFLTPDEVRRELVRHHLSPVGKKLSEVNLRVMEERLRTMQLVESAECYKTQGGNVGIDIRERVPVMRVMAQNGDDYYIDREGQMLKNTDYTCNLPVATGCISPAYARRVLAPIGHLVMSDAFWRSQTEQFNVLPDSTLEMVPRVGSHVVALGRPVNITRKLQRLRKFYQYGLSQTGWNKYQRISVEYDNQIVCKKATHQAPNTKH